jgi:hypothetical protein
MTDQTKSVLKLGVTLLCVIAGGGLLFARLRNATRTGEEGAQIWFYDESEKRLYPAARETIPPHAGVGGVKNDGVHAIVAAPKGETANASLRRIAYLETYTPELKQMLEDVRFARAQHRPLPFRIPSRDSDYFGTNTLVRRVNEPVWHPVSSPEGQRITAEWRGWQTTNGAPLVLCLPD